ncbi:MAG: adenosylcobinamide-GDP ribazoletransferase [Arachnia sp.]
MRSLHAALGLFTVLRVPPFDLDRATAARALRALPWVGLLLGAAAGALSWAAGGGLLGAVLALTLLAAATGALHLDGLADTADGLGSRKPRDEALAIMKRSDIGPMGVVSLVLVLAIDATALARLGAPLALVALAAAAATGRVAVQAACTGSASARPGGFGSLFAGAARPAEAVVNAILLTTVVLLAGWWAAGLLGAAALAVGLAVAVVVATIWGRRLARHFAGWTGDTFGSLIEVTQCATLVSTAIAAGYLVVP